MEQPFSPLRFRGDALELLDQTELPNREVWLSCTSPESVAAAIRRLAVRGAPAIGVAAGYGLVLAVRGAASAAELDRRVQAAADLIVATRPTAVNLRWAIEEGRKVVARMLPRGPAATEAALRAWAEQLHAADLEGNLRIGEYGAALFQPGDRVLTHCNAGALATGGFGTAVGVITAAFQRGRLAEVWVDETRPLLQGARLTAWELKRQGIPFRLITDSSAGSLMAAGRVDRIVVGADRIAANGDTANKIGTYTVAVLAQYHHIPFYVAAPLSTVDLKTPSGASIPIEERAAEEVTQLGGHRVAPPEIEALNLAFDVTPHALIHGIITDAGVVRPPYGEGLRRVVEEGQRLSGSEDGGGGGN